MRGWLGFIELGVTLLAVLGWGVLELVCLRLDRRRAALKARAGEATSGTAAATAPADD